MLAPNPIETMYNDLRKASPFLYAYAMQLPKIRTTERAEAFIWGDGQVELYQGIVQPNHPKGMATWNVAQVTPPLRTFVLAHELCHSMLKHCHMIEHPDAYPEYKACAAHDQERLRKAIEYHCNSVVFDILGYKIPDVSQPRDPSRPVSFDWPPYDPKGMSWQQHWDKLGTLRPPPPDDDEDDEDDEDESPTQPSPQNPQGEPTKRAGPGQSDIKPTQGDTSEEASEDDAAGELVASSMSPEQVDAAIRRAMGVSGQEPGTLPGEIIAALETAEATPLPWKALLRRITASASEARGTWRKPSRKGTAVHPRKGTTQKPVTVNAMVYCDTSGSMDDAVLYAITAGLLDVPGCKVTLKWFDTRVYEPVELFDSEQVKALKIKGRGGTDILPVIADWVGLKRSFDIGITVTDGYVSAYPPGKVKGMNWILTEKNPSFAREIHDPVYFAMDGSWKDARVRKAV